MPDKPPILDHAATLSDATRCRVLAVLESQELMVSELCQALQMPQSTMSRHLKVLGDGGWVQSRRDGTSNLYRLLDELPAGAQALWSLVSSQIAETEQSRQDQARLNEVLRSRRSRSQEFFSESASDWDRVRDDLFGRRFDLMGLLGLCDPDWLVGDLGCGTGRLSAALAPFVQRVIAVDGSPAMLEAAEERLASIKNVVIRSGRLEELPITNHELDVVTLVLALHHVSHPQKVLREAHRVLKRDGRLIIVDLMPHDQEELREQMGHIWLGFSRDQVLRDLEASGFMQSRVQALPVEPGATGPALFVATAQASARTQSDIQFDLAETSEDLTDAVQVLNLDDIPPKSS